MRRKMPMTCPVCQSSLEVTELHCHTCDTTIRGHFTQSKLASLNEEQLMFVEVFIKSRGNIKEVERELGVSYPTVRGKLESVIEALGYRPEKVNQSANRRKEILNKLEQGGITTEEALRLLNE